MEFISIFRRKGSKKLYMENSDAMFLLVWVAINLLTLRTKNDNI